MTVKQFFKSAAFKSLTVLLAIVIVAGALLAIFNDLLKVTDEEKFKRSLQKIYGGDAEVKTTILASDAESVKIDGNTVNQAYLMDDGNYLIQATGNGGWQNGSITVWVIMSCTGSKESNSLKWNGIERVVYESNDKQSYITRFSDADYALFADHNTDLVAGKLFGDGINVVKTGASAPFTFGALTAAVNATVNYFKQTILGVATEPDIYKYQSYINLEETVITPNAAEKTVVYRLAMKKNGPAPSFTVDVTVKDGKITEYNVTGTICDPDNFVQDDSTGAQDANMSASLKDGTYFIGKGVSEIESLINEDGKVTSDTLTGGSLLTGATYSSGSLIYAAAFATANYEMCLYPIAHEDWVTEVVPTVDGTDVTYALVMKAFGMSAPVHATITVKDGKITAFATEGDLTTMDDGTYIGSIDVSLKDGSYFENKTVADLEALLTDKGETNATLLGGASLSTGASNSSTVLIRAAIYALANYETYLAKGGEQA